MKRSILWVIGSVGLIGLFLGVLYWYNSSSSTPEVSFSPQKTQLYSVGDSNNNPLNILATTLPQFAVKLSSDEFNNLWQADAKERDSSVDAIVVNKSGDTSLLVDTKFDSTKKQAIFTPNSGNQFKPGLYTLNIKVKTNHGEYTTISQDFTWGVLAINTGKATYKMGETVKIGMGVLDDRGHTKCIASGDINYNTAKVWLTIISPSGKKKNLSTEDGTIVGSPECAPISVTNNPDFQAQFLPDEPGKYIMQMTAENINGKRSIEDYFNVVVIPPVFDIARTSYPTRIYPLGYYPVEVSITPHKDYQGYVSDVVPENFRINEISNNGYTVDEKNFQQVTWHVNWKSGLTYKLTYVIGFPLVSPEFYLVGPFTIGDPSAGPGQGFEEGREWQIASDAISMVQNVTPTTIASGTSLSLNWSPHPITGDLEIVICSETSNQSISTPTRESGGSPRPNRWSSGFSITSGSLRLAVFYRIATVNDSSSVTCTFGGSTGVKAIQLLEYSGLSTSSTKDTSKTHAGASCSGGTFTTNSGTFTIGNPVVLIIAAFTATNQRTVTGVTSGFTTENAFNGASAGTFSMDDQVTSSITDYTDTVTYNTNGGTCAAGIVSFNSPISISQNGYRFFENANSTTPGSPIDAVNTDITLSTPHRAFRLRFLLDVDGTQTMGIGTGDLILQYATLSATLTCATASYDVVSTPLSQSDIAFNPNATPHSGNTIASSGNDPADGGYSTRLESYYQDDTSSSGPSDGSAPGDITNDNLSIAGNQAGLWDMSLIDNTDDTQTNTYCLKITNGDGSDLSSYVNIPQVTTFHFGVTIRGPGNSGGGSTIIQGPGHNNGSTIFN